MKKFNKNISSSVPDAILQKYHSSISNEKTICRAPFTALYFHPDGEVGACCLNKNSYLYGRYPTNTIKEILESTPRKVHQKYIRNNNFLLGCNICNDNLLNQNFSGLMANGYKYQSLKKHITRIDFELSHQCNFDCIMCERDKTSSNSFYNNDFIEEIKPYLKKLEYANFIGGEPFLINIYYQIWEILLDVNPNCLINIQTNGSILNDRIIKLLENKNFITVISLDSVNNTSYSEIRKGGNLNLVLKNFEIFNKFMQNKSRNMQISVCPLQTNYNEIPDIIDFANNNKCYIFFNHVDKPKELSLKYFNSEKLNKIIEIYSLYSQNFNTDLEHTKQNLRALLGLIQLLKAWQSEALEREKNSVLVLKNDISEFFAKIKDNYNKNIADDLVKLLPENFMISEPKYREILETDFEDKINQLRKHGHNQEEIIKIALKYFEIYKTQDF